MTSAEALVERVVEGHAAAGVLDDAGEGVDAAGVDRALHEQRRLGVGDVDERAALGELAAQLGVAEVLLRCGAERGGEAVVEAVAGQADRQALAEPTRHGARVRELVGVREHMCELVVEGLHHRHRRARLSAQDDAVLIEQRDARGALADLAEPAELGRELAGLGRDADVDGPDGALTRRE